MNRIILTIIGILGLTLLGAVIFNESKNNNFSITTFTPKKSPDANQNDTQVTTTYTTEEYTTQNTDYSREPFFVYTNQSTTPNSPTFTPPTNSNNNQQSNTNNTSCPSTQTRALWVWDSSVITNNTKQSNLLSFAKSKNTNTLYLESYGIITNGTQSEKNELSDFINTFKQNCINTELLAGDSSWYLPNNHSTVVSFAQKAVDFANSINTKPTAIHLDIEPYGYSGGNLWNANNGANRADIMSEYIAMLKKVKSTLGGTLILSVDVPFWYDSSSTLQNSGAGYFSKEILKTVDTMTIMDYRDTAFGIDSSGNKKTSKDTSSNGIYDLGYDEVNYAQSLGKKVIIGVETKCFSDSESEQITFCGSRTVNGNIFKKGQNFLETELSKVRNAFESFSSFGGTAIHHYDSYKILPENY